MTSSPVWPSTAFVPLHNYLSRTGREDSVYRESEGERAQKVVESCEYTLSEAMTRCPRRSGQPWYLRNSRMHHSISASPSLYTIEQMQSQNGL